MRTGRTRSSVAAFEAGDLGPKNEAVLAFLHSIEWSPQPILSQAQAMERIGTWLWAVDIALAEYRALRDIERWADQTLARIDQ